MTKLTQVERFAEIIAEAGHTTRAAHRMGISTRYANALMQRIRREMGAQAV